MRGSFILVVCIQAGGGGRLAKGERALGKGPKGLRD